MLEKIKSIDKRIIIGGATVILITLVVFIILMLTIFNEAHQDSTGDGTEPTYDAMSESVSESLDSQNSHSESTEDTGEASTTIVDKEDKEDPELNITDDKLEGGASVEISDIGDIETSIGVDVSRYQGAIDWKKVSDSGISFTMIRVGYRTTKTGEIIEDPYAKYNIVNALINGIDVGVYFFSSAVSEAEAKEEANWVADFIAGYNITYPVAYNCENYSNSDSRQNVLSKDERSSMAIAFLDTIKQRGYTPMFYGSKYEMENDRQWNTSLISNYGKIWVAYYQDKPYSDGDSPAYSGVYHMWQYTAKGIVSGIDAPVDINVSYLGIETNDSIEPDSNFETVTISPEANMNFQNVNESVTAKIEVNLRDIPSQGSDSTVIATIKNGEVVKRTGMSPYGWSRLEYNGQICYAVSSYLTTDTNPTTEATTPNTQDETTTMKNQFIDVNVQVTPKEEVNLRTLPSVTDSEVVVTIKNGDVVTKTGVSNLGWARVIYNGQILYCIDSYLQEVE